MVEEAKKYHFNIVRVSSTKRRGSRIVGLDDEWKLFNSGADPSMSTQAGEGILTTSQLSECVFDWIPWKSQACLLKIEVKNRSLCLLQVYAPNALREYQAFEDNVNYALQRVGSTKSTVLLRDFNAHIETYACATIGKSKTSRLLFADDFVLLAFSESGFRHPLNSFAAACDIVGMKISTSKIEVLYLSRNPAQCSLQVGDVSLKEAEKFKYLVVVFTTILGSHPVSYIS